MRTNSLGPTREAGEQEPTDAHRLADAGPRGPSHGAFGNGVQRVVDFVGEIGPEPGLL